MLINMPLGRLRAHARAFAWRNFGCILAPVPMTRGKIQFRREGI